MIQQDEYTDSMTIARLKVDVAEAVLQDRQKALRNEKIAQSQAEVLVSNLVKALSEVRESSSKSGSNSEEDQALVKTRLEELIEEKDTAMNAALARRGELKEELHQLQTQVDVSRKPANAPQEKLKEALALVHELKETLAQTVKHNQNTSVKQDQMKVAMTKREQQWESRQRSKEAEKVRAMFKQEREQGRRMPTSKMFHVAKSTSWMDLIGF
mmetsp:Transcript_44452/g.85028  ORF Transcript_44452/g.85028 Transcript_44452/m.85028 type:complete len:213 (+) Transcript_44452:102-740(+)